MLAFPLTTGIEMAQSVVSETYSEIVPFQPDRTRRNLEREYLTDASRFVDVDGTEIHYRIEGCETGPTVLLIHGTYSSLHTWDGWVEELADEYRLVRLDMPGFGLTGPRADGPNRLEGLIESVAKFCDELELSELAVVGNSLGGAVAWRLSIDRPDLVSKLGRKYTPLGSELLPRYATPRSVIRLILKDAYGDPSKVTPDVVRRYHDLLLRSGNRAAVIEIASNYQREHDDEHSSLDLLNVRPRHCHRVRTSTPTFRTATKSPMCRCRRCSSGEAKTSGSRCRSGVNWPTRRRIRCSRATRELAIFRWKKPPYRPPRTPLPFSGRPSRPDSRTGSPTAHRRALEIEAFNPAK